MPTESSKLRDWANVAYSEDGARGDEAEYAGYVSGFVDQVERGGNAANPRSVNPPMFNGSPASGAQWQAFDAGFRRGFSAAIARNVREAYRVPPEAATVSGKNPPAVISASELRASTRELDSIQSSAQVRPAENLPPMPHKRLDQTIGSPFAVPVGGGP